MSRQRAVRGSIASKGLVPLLDTLFQLVFALLVVSGPRTVNRAETLLLRLPRVERSEEAPPSSAHRLVLAVDERARVSVLGDALPLSSRSELDRRIGASLGGTVPEEASVEIRADARAPHGVVVELLQHLRLLGFADVRLAAVAEAGARDLFGGER